MCSEPGLSDFPEDSMASSALHTHGALHHKRDGEPSLLNIAFTLLFLAPDPLAAILAHIPSLNQL